MAAQLFIIFIGGFTLFCIIAVAVKMAVREALSDFEDDLIKELKKLNSKKDNLTL